MTRLVLLFVAFVNLPLVAVSVRAAEPGGSALYLIDAHSQADSEKVLKRVISLMDRAGVRRTLLSARGHLQSDAIVKFSQQHPGRITASVRTKGGAYRDNSEKYYKALKRSVESGKFGAIAELLLYHAQKGDKAPEIVVYPDDKRVQTALTYAKKEGWPLVVHIEFASLSGKQKARYMEQLEAMLAQNPDHPFVLIHMGQLRSGEVQRLMASHNNVYFMTSHTNPVAIRESRQPWTPMFKGDVLAPEWKKLVIQYPDRFVLAFDNVWPNHWGDYYLQEARYWKTALADLPREVARAVAHENAERLWNLPRSQAGRKE